LQVRRKDEVEAQSRSKRDRWTFYETIRLLRETKCRFAPGLLFSLFSEVGMILREKFRDLLGDRVRTEALKIAGID